MYSACAGTCRSTVSHCTSSTGLPRRKPAIRYSSTSGGAGTIAANVVAGSVPIATATSIRPSRTLVSVVAGIVAAFSAATVPPDVCAINSTRADKSFASLPVAARSRSRRCSAAFFCRCQCIPVVSPSYTCMRYIPTLRLPDFGSRVTTHGSVMNGPPSLGQVVSTGSFRRSIPSPPSSTLRCTTCLHAASFAAIVLGKKLPTSASVGSSFSLANNPCGVGGCTSERIRPAISSSESTSRASLMRRSLPNWFISTFAPGKPVTFSNKIAGPPALAVPLPSLAARSAISAISRYGLTASRMRRSSPALSSCWIQSRRSVVATCALLPRTSRGVFHDNESDPFPLHG